MTQQERVFPMGNRVSFGAELRVLPLARVARGGV